MIEFLAESDDDSNDFEYIETKFSCDVYQMTEKLSSLQFNFTYEVTWEGHDKKLCVEIESGQNNGTQVNEVEWIGLDESCTPKTRTISVLKDIVLDTSAYGNSFELKKAQAVFNRRKNELFEHYRRNAYDKYVTGNNTSLQLDPLLNQLSLNYIYKEEEVDINYQ